MTQPMTLLARITFVVAMAGAAAAALAQTPERAPNIRAVKIWDIALGTPAAALPPAFAITACGTNGGPPSIPLQGFHEFAKCRKEAETGLYEVWFSYDDEFEYWLRAARAPLHQIMTNRANQLFDLLVVYSFLFDDQGRVQGYRIASDAREDPHVRLDADMLEALSAFVFGIEGWNCTDLLRNPGEEPLGGTFVKRLCEKVDAGRYITMRSHRYLKPGQMADRGGAPGANEFEVGVWAEVIAANLVGKAAPAR
jgi:hypothetical protein